MPTRWLWRFAKPILFLFDAEAMHHTAVRCMRWISKWLGDRGMKRISGGAETLIPSQLGSLPQVFGIEFASRVGLAAGFDKNAELLAILPSLGFGFAEIGTVTPLPQPGNPKPRLFRDPKRQALFNCLGFNNQGAIGVAGRVAEARHLLPPLFRIGINLGKNRDTPLGEAHLDYGKAVKPFEGLSDYLVINVSSPNTPGLRSLQTVETLRPIVSEVQEQILRWSKRPPLLLKLAPELDLSVLRDIMPQAESWGIDGWILTNTLGGSWKISPQEERIGGWSGGPLQEKSRAALQRARNITQKPLISVGGIISAEEAVERRRLGADLIQIYTGWVMQGPSFPWEVSQELAREGLSTV